MMVTIVMLLFVSFHTTFMTTISCAFLWGSIFYIYIYFRSPSIAKPLTLVSEFTQRVHFQPRVNPCLKNIMMDADVKELQMDLLTNGNILVLLHGSVVTLSTSGNMSYVIAGCQSTYDGMRGCQNQTGKNGINQNKRNRICVYLMTWWWWLVGYLVGIYLLLKISMTCVYLSFLRKSLNFLWISWGSETSVSVKFSHHFPAKMFAQSTILWRFTNCSLWKFIYLR